MINARGEVSPRGWDGYQRHLLEEEGVELDARGRIDLRRFRWDPDARPSRVRRPAKPSRARSRR